MLVDLSGWVLVNLALELTPETGRPQNEKIVEITLY